MPLFFKHINTILFFISITLLLEAKNRDIIVCIDESGSMQGAKYESMIYSLQSFLCVLDESDKLFLSDSKGSVELNTGNKTVEIGNLRKKKHVLKHPEYDILTHAMPLLRNNPEREKILILYGDGAWGQSNVYAELVALYATIKPKIYFLKVENKKDVLEKESFAETNLAALGLMEVIKVQGTDTGKLVAELEKLSRNIVDADVGSVNPEIDGPTVKLTSKFPLTALLVFVQGNRKLGEMAKLSKVNRALEWGEEYELSNFKINPSINRNSKLSGRFYRIQMKGGKVIPEGTDIELEFEGEFTADNIILIPLTSVAMQVRPGKNLTLEDASKRLYSICEDDEFANLELLLTYEDGTPLRKEALSEVNAKARYGGNRESSFTYEKGKLKVKIPVVGDSVLVEVSAQYDGYFLKKSPIITIVKRRCKAKTTIDPDLRIIIPEKGVVDFSRNGSCIEAQIFLKDGTIIEPDHYDLEFMDQPWFTEVTITPLADRFRICFNRRKFMCDCMVPYGKLEGRFMASPKSEGYDFIQGKWEFTILKEEGFWARCKGCLLMFFGIITLLTLIWAYMTKPRFHKTAKIKYEEKPLRKRHVSADGFTYRLPTGFVSRWLIPYIPEKKRVKTLTFIAAKRKNRVYLHRNSYRSDLKMDGMDLSLPKKGHILVTGGRELSYEEAGKKYTFVLNIKN